MTYQPQGLPVLILDDIVGLISDPRTKPIEEVFFGKNFMCKFPNGEIYFDLKLALDTDGSRFAIPDAHGHKEDPSGQATTATRKADGSSLDADEINYFVLPGDFWIRHRIGKGDIGVVIAGIRLSYACFGDVGPAGSLGEASIALHRDLGHETVVGGHLRNEGLNGGAITIVFPGSGNGFGRTNKESEGLGKVLFAKLQQEARDFALSGTEAQAKARQEEAEMYFQKYHHYPPF